MKSRKCLLIDVPKSETRDNWYYLKADLSVTGGDPLPEHQRQIWFALPADRAEEFVFDDCSDCFLLGVLYFAMRFGYDISVKGTVSGTLVDNLNDEVIPIIDAYRPNMTRISVEAENVKDFPEGGGVATGFSGGVDSFDTIAGNIGGRGEGSPRDPLTHLFFFNVGTHGQGRSFEELEHVRRKFLMRYEKLLSAARMIGLPFIAMDSNVHSFIPDDIQASITVCNAAAVHFLRKGLKKYLLSSDGYEYRQLFRVFKISNVDMDIIAPLLCQWLGDDSLRLLPYGTKKSRIEKTRLIADYPPAMHFLNVCNSTAVMDENCSLCLKCRRTMLNLEILGKLDNFREAFKVDMWRTKYRSRDFAEVLYPDTNNLFILAFHHYAKEHNIDIKSWTSATDRFFGYMHSTWVYRALTRLHLLKIIKLLVGRH